MLDSHESQMFPIKYTVGPAGLPGSIEEIAAELMAEIHIGDPVTARRIANFIGNHRSRAKVFDQIIVELVGEKRPGEETIRDRQLTSRLVKAPLEMTALPLFYRIGQRKIPNPRKIYNQLKSRLEAKIGSSYYWTPEHYGILAQAVAAVSREKDRAFHLKPGDRIAIEKAPAYMDQEPGRPPALQAMYVRAKPNQGG